jgi:U6 snRNA-associated Sm-like protein LSm7
VTEESRNLGLVVARGTQICLVSPSQGIEEIANPFAVDDEEIQAAD